MLLFICCGHLDESLAIANVLVLSLLMLWPSALQCFDGSCSCTLRVSQRPAVHGLSIYSLRGCAMACFKDRDLMTETHFSGAHQEFKKGFLKVTNWGLEFILILLLEVTWPCFYTFKLSKWGILVTLRAFILMLWPILSFRSLVGECKKNNAHILNTSLRRVLRCNCEHSGFWTHPYTKHGLVSVVKKYG